MKYKSVIKFLLSILGGFLLYSFLSYQENESLIYNKDYLPPSLLVILILYIIFLLIDVENVRKDIENVKNLITNSNEETKDKIEAVHSQNESNLNEIAVKYNDTLSLSIANNIHAYMKATEAIEGVSNSDIPKCFAELSDEAFNTLDHIRTKPAAVIFHDEIYDKLVDLKLHFSGKIRNGVVEFTGPNCRKKTGACYQLSNKFVQAISYPNPEFWTSKNGMDFFDMNIVGLQSNLYIKRIFILQNLSDESFRNKFREVVKEHLNIRDKFNENYNITFTTSKLFNEKYITEQLETYKEITYFDREFENPIPDISFFDNKIISTWDLGSKDNSIQKSRIIVDNQLSRKVTNIFKELEGHEINIFSESDIDREFERYLKGEI